MVLPAIIGRFGCGDGAFYGGLLGVGVAFAAGLCALLGDFCVGVDRAICRPQAGGQKAVVFSGYPVFADRPGLGGGDFVWLESRCALKQSMPAGRQKTGYCQKAPL